MAQVEEDDESASDSEDPEPEAIGTQQGTAQKLARAEDVLSCAKTIEDLQRERDESGPTVVPVEKESHCKEALVCSQKEASSEKDAKPVFVTLRCILNAAERQDPTAFFPAAAATGAMPCLRRVAALMEPIKTFATTVRVQEGILSAAQVGAISQKSPITPWNSVMHDLAEGRKALLHTAERSSRAAGWLRAQENLAKEANAQCGASGAIAPCNLLRPCGAADVQVVLYKVKVTSSTFAAYLNFGLFPSSMQQPYCRKGKGLNMLFRSFCFCEVPCVAFPVLPRYLPSPQAKPKQENYFAASNPNPSHLQPES